MSSILQGLICQYGRADEDILKAIGNAVIQRIAEINEPITFSPAVASWLFLGAAINLSFPQVLPAVTWEQLGNWTKMAMRLVLPLGLFNGLWLPANKLLHHMAYTHFSQGGPVDEWLPFISLFIAIGLFIASLFHVGMISWSPLPHSTNTSTKEQKRRPAKKSKPTNYRVTRSGKVFGRWE